MCSRVGSIAFAVVMLVQIAAADGVFMPQEEYKRLYGDAGATSTEQKGIVIKVAGGREALLLQTTYQGPAVEFAWVVPVPGEPLADDVFIASSDFIDQVLDATQPPVHTHIDIPRPPSDAMGAEDMMEAAAPGEIGGIPSVTVHRRMEVGDYDVSVLSATGAGVLIDWLNEHGYATPEDHADVFGHYVGKDWYFVALRVLPGVVEERPVLDDVKPIGIEFPTETLTYPLYISRSSSREKTALTLIALTPDAVKVPQLHRARLRLGEHAAGTSYARIRRQTVREALQQPAAILEYAGPRATRELTGHYAEESSPAAAERQWAGTWATRVWTVLDRDEMQDLTFVPADLTASLVRVNREGKLPPPPLLERLDIPIWIVAAGIFLVLGFGRIGARRLPTPVLYAAMIVGGAAVCLPGLPDALQSWVVGLTLIITLGIAGFVMATECETDETPGTTWWHVITWALLAAGWIVMAQILAGVGWAHLSEPETVIPLVLWIVLLLFEVIWGWRRMDRSTRIRAMVASLLALVAFAWAMEVGVSSLYRYIYLHALGAGTWLAAGGTVLGILVAAHVALALTARDRRITAWEHTAIVGVAGLAGVLIAWAGGAFGSFIAYNVPALLTVSLLFGYAWAGLGSEDHVRRAARVFALTLLVVGAGLAAGRIDVIPAADAGTTMERHSGLDELDRALTTLDDAVLACLEDTGCYPASLEDLTASAAPEHGLDSSGNRVPMPDNWAGPYLQRLPEDPLTQARDTWVYEVTGAPMIDSGGFTITLERVTARGHTIRRVHESGEGW